MRVVLVFLMLFTLSYAQDNNESVSSVAQGEYATSGIGVKLSYGEGSGIVYRVFFDDYYIDNTLLIAGQKDEYAASFFGSYDVTFAYYFFESSDKWLNLKSLTSIGFEYSYDKYYQGSLPNTTTISNAYRAYCGFGGEIGSRKSGNVVLGMDLLYGVSAQNNFDKISLTPGIAIQLMYIW